MKMIPFTEKSNLLRGYGEVAPKRATRSVTREKAAISKDARPMGVPRRRSCPSVTQAGPRVG